MSAPLSTKSLTDQIQIYLKPPVINMLFLGFAAGLPILLIFSSLSLWLREAGVSRSAVTYFSWAALGYSFKFIWAPLIDQLPLPGLRLLGRRRSWLLLTQLLIIASISAMALVDPAQGAHALTVMAIAAVCLGFASATQDIAIDAYRIEVAPVEIQALLAATYVAGYRIGMIAAGAGAIYLAQMFGSELNNYHYAAWRLSYLCMAALMLIGVCATLLIAEPKSQRAQSNYSNLDYARFLALFLLVVLVLVVTYWVLAEPLEQLKLVLNPESDQPIIRFFIEVLHLLSAIGLALLAAFGAAWLGVANQAMVRAAYIAPISDFFQRYGKSALLLLLLVGFYRVSDIVLGIISNVFYQDLGFDKQTIAGVVKTFGLVMTLLGGFLGGHLALRYGVMRMLFVGALLSALTNLLFMWLASVGDDFALLCLVVGADNLAAGLASAAFIAFLSSLTNISFTATQYAIFSSLMTLAPKLMGGYSGSIVDSMGYSNFFLLTALLGLPVLYLVFEAQRRLFKAN